jgi:predicted alpha/beta hydrolase
VVQAVPNDAPATPSVLRVVSGDGASAELQLVGFAGDVGDVVFWCPAMGVPARHYLPLANALALRGVATAILDWRGLGSSNRRAGRTLNWGYAGLLMDDLPAALGVLRDSWPRLRIWLGGHSMGGQIAILFASLHPGEYAGLLLVASGSPYWRRFSHPWLLRLFCALLRPIAAMCGYYPGRRLGFAGNEARGLMADWSRTVRSGRYEPHGLVIDFAERLAKLRLPILALRLRDDWLVPMSSVDWLLGMLPAAFHEVQELSRYDLGGTPADHFAWMRTPEAVAKRMAETIERTAINRT